ncbi:MAG: hypothetical protein HUU22_04900 [Phycisphaerae bacterium]|nr:hypothetical protein [Phycisphaerae bacterium]NUQ45351.1 hypothetical protein [Phycisphaerae bacterium]
MTSDRADRHEVIQRGQAQYEESIRARVDPACAGQFVVVDVDSGDYEVDGDKLAALVLPQGTRGNYAYAEHAECLIFRETLQSWRFRYAVSAERFAGWMP